MSDLSRFMHTARAILDANDPKRIAPGPQQPPIFVRTNYLFVEIDEALAKAVELAASIKIARLNTDPATTRKLNADLGTVLRQAAQLTAWAEEQFQKDYGNAD